MKPAKYEFATAGHPHFEEHHEDGEAHICVATVDQCAVVFSIEANPDEQKRFSEAIKISVEKLDEFFGGDFAELFKGLEVQIGSGLTEHGGLANAEENKILFDKDKMLMSVAEEEDHLVELGYLNEGDRRRAVPEELHDQSVIVYELPHEIGHIIEGRVDRLLGLGKYESYRRADGLTDKSPTLYGEQPEHSREAFAEAFAYMVMGAHVEPELETVVLQAIAELRASVQTSGA